MLCRRRRLLTDDKFLADYISELLPRLNDMRVRCAPFTVRLAPQLLNERCAPPSAFCAQQKRYAELRSMYRRMVIKTCLLLFALISALHVTLLYRPELLRARLSERLISEIWSVSPVFKYLQVRGLRRERAHACVVRLAPGALVFGALLDFSEC